MNNDYGRHRLESAIAILENMIEHEKNNPVEKKGDLQYAQRLSIKININELQRLKKKLESR